MAKQSKRRNETRDVTTPTIKLLNKIPGCRVWRNQSGMVRVIKGKAQHWMHLSPKGTSDIVGWYKGRFLAVECKLPGGEPTAEQTAFLAAVTDAGGIAFVICHPLDAPGALGLLYKLSASSAPKTSGAPGGR